MSQNHQGTIRSVGRPADTKLAEWFGEENCWHFLERPDKIGMDRGVLPANLLGLPHQYGRVFSQNYELRWEDDRFWLAQETADGDFETEETEFLLRAKEKSEQREEYKKIRVVHYYRNGLVIYTRFREVR